MSAADLEDPWTAAAAAFEAKPKRPRKWACTLPDCDGEPHEAEGYHWCDHPLDSDAHTSWCRHARAEQRPPLGVWFIWLILAGRGFGKTRTGAEYVYAKAIEHPGSRVALVARTFADGRDVMVEGESGLLAIIPDDQLRGGSRTTGWNRSMGEMFLANGSSFKIYSSEKPAALRGPQHHYAWGDEAASWLDAQAGTDEDTTWSNLMFGLRLGTNPRAVITTTPKPVKLIRGTKRRAGILKAPGTAVTTGSTYANLKNVAETFKEMILSRYEGTRLGRQELHAEVLDDAEGALWQRPWIEDQRILNPEDIWRITGGGIRRLVIGVDPQGGTGEDSLTGIVAAGKGRDGRGYVLRDASINGTPAEWANVVTRLYHELAADLIVAERNFGGEMVRSTIMNADASVNLTMVNASRGKAIRAEPISAMYQQRKWSHVGTFDELEDELVTWEPDSGQDSPNRLDALVWAATALFPPAQDTHVVDTTDERLGGRRRR